MSTRQGSIKPVDNWERGQSFRSTTQAPSRPNSPRCSQILDTWAAGSGRHGLHGCGSWLALHGSLFLWCPGRAWSGWGAQCHYRCHWGAHGWTHLRFICLSKSNTTKSHSVGSTKTIKLLKLKTNLLCIYKRGKMVGLHITFSKTRMLPCSLVSVLGWPQGFCGAGGLKYEGRLGSRVKWESHSHWIPSCCSLGNGWRSLVILSQIAFLSRGWVNDRWSKFKPIWTHSGCHLTI